jgi:hypothetical protein
LLPATNERAILERRARDQGIAVDDIGRIAFQDFGKGPDGKTIALGAYDPSGINIMAGYNLSKITQETIDERRDKARDKMSKEGFEEFNKALTAFEEMFFGEDKIKDNTEEEIIRREYIDREKKREKIQEDLAAAGFGESGAVGIDKDMDRQIIDDYTYTPPSRDAGANIVDEVALTSGGGGANIVDEVALTSGGGGGNGGVESRGGGASYGTRSESGWASSPFKKGGLVKRKPYGDGGIVDLL